MKLTQSRKTALDNFTGNQIGPAKVKVWTLTHEIPGRFAHTSLYRGLAAPIDGITQQALFTAWRHDPLAAGFIA
jgi:hypothetical protein